MSAEGITPASWSMTESRVDNLTLVAETSPDLDVAYRVRMGCLFVLAVLAAVGNSLVLYFVLLPRSTHRASRVPLIIALCCVNLLIVFINIPLDIVWHITVAWHGGTFLCKGLQCLKMQTTLLASFLIASLSIDRCVNILFPLRFSVTRLLRVKNLTRASICLSLLLSLPQVFVFRVADCPPGSSCEGSQQCTTMTTLTDKSMVDRYNIFYASWHFFVPLVVVFLCYTSIVLRLAVRAANNANNRQLGLNLVYKSKPTRSSSEAAVTTELTHETKAEEPQRGHSLTLPNPRRTAAAAAAEIRSPNHNIVRARNKMLLMTITVVAFFILTNAPYYIAQYHESQPLRLTRTEKELLSVMQYTHLLADPVISGVFIVTRRRRHAIPRQSPPALPVIYHQPMGTNCRV